MIDVCILDYGSGNVKSVLNAVNRITERVVVSNQIGQLRNASHLILPGVGSFKASMDRITSTLPVEELSDLLAKGKPFLGICVGMQVLASVGIEFVEAKGLGFIPGTVSKIDSDTLPLPHVGWNNLSCAQPNLITKDINQEDDFYFTHSYGFTAISHDFVLGTTEYGTVFPSIIGRENIYGVQFHPEKSQKSGTKILRNFLDIQ
jgi:imidazole glycerol-phosphate synthase subunit HisH